MKRYSRIALLSVCLAVAVCGIQSASAAEPPPMSKELPAMDYDRIVQALRRKPWDPANVKALADWFETNDKPRAKLLRLQLEFAPIRYDDPRFKPLQKEIYELRSEHKKRWLKPLGSLADRANIDFEIGLIDSISMKEAQDGDLAEIEKSPEVRELRLPSKQLTEAAYERMVRLPNLEQLTIDGEAALPKGAWAHLEKLPPWTVVRIYTTEEDRTAAKAMDAKRIAKFKDLSAEEKHSAGVRFLGVIGDGRPAYGKPQTHANLSQAGVDDSHMPFLAAVPELETVYISDSDVTAEGIALLAGLKELKSLSLYQTRVKSIAALAGLKKLETLALFPDYEIKMGDRGLEGLQNFTNLQEVYLNDEAISDATVKRFASMAKMKKLDLSLGNLKNENSLAAFSGMIELKSLSIHGGNISDNALKHLAELKKLETLSISVARGNGGGFKHLSGIAGLQVLSLSGDGVTDEAMLHLRENKKLQTIMAQGTAVTAEGAKKLAAGLPHVTIILDKTVVKTPRETYTFVRRKLNDKVSLLVPKDWGRETYEGESSIHAREDGWQHVGGWSGTFVGPADIHFYSWKDSETAEDAMMASVNNNSHLNPKVLKKNVVAIEGSKDTASCFYRNDHGEYLVCAAKVGNAFVVIDCHAPKARFEEFAGLFSYVAKSIRISDDTAKHGDEMVEVRADTLKPK